MSDRACEVCGQTRFRRLFTKLGHTFERCDSCQLERIHPPPTDAELSVIYGQHYYDAWGLQEDAHSVARLKRATFDRRMRLLRDLPRGSRVLDCGAATGLGMESIANARFHPYGIELSAFGAGEIARRFGQASLFQGQVEAAEFPHLPEQPFAAVLMYDFLEHVRDPRAVLERSHALLADGGRLLVCTPCTGTLTHRAMGPGWTHYKPEHLYYFGRDSLRRLLRSCGFEVVSSRPAWKALSLAYLAHQFDVYPNRLVGGVVHLAARACPPKLRPRPVWVTVGEVLVVARRVRRP
jgi:SAM-dependent methyltransferase